jgi:mannose-1-phosphate guanylyltransferase
MASPGSGLGVMKGDPGAMARRVSRSSSGEDAMNEPVMDVRRAFLLAAGLGTRLRPITDGTPKCLVEVGGRTLLDIWLDALAEAGVQEVLVNTHHLADLVEAHVARRSGPPVVRLSHESVLLGSAGTLLANRDFVAGEDMFLAVNADNLTDFDLRVLVDAHRCGATDATLSVFRAARPSECGIVEVSDGRVVGFVEKPQVPPSDLANAGMYAFSPSVLDEIAEPLPRDIGFDLLPRLVGRARAVPLGDSFFLDIGTPAALALARDQWESRATA